MTSSNPEIPPADRDGGVGTSMTGASGLDFPVVGLGASAGGVQALLRFFGQAPCDMGMAFVVVLHLSPWYTSQADQVLQCATQMPVRQVTEPVPVEKDHVYVIPPSKNIELYDGILRVTDAQHADGDPATIDTFFRSLAEVHQERAVSVILSGSGSDGALGISRIKEFGGVTIAQSPADAEHPEMPQNAIATGLVDVVLPVADIPQKLTELWRSARAMRLPERLAEASESMTPAGEASTSGADAEHALQAILASLRASTGHDFSHYKRATMLRRIGRRMHVTASMDLPAYHEFLQAHPHEGPALLRDMLIGVTNFFRDREAFGVLEHEIVSELFEDKGEGDQVRVWVPGCSTGEEAYALAMLLCESAQTHTPGPAIQVFATDIDEQAIAIARAARYPASVSADVPPARLRKFFTVDGAHYRIDPALREKVLFALHNVLRDPPFSRLDLVSCRNLLIYLDRRAQRQVLEMFHFSLQGGGYLFLGNSESADVADDLFTTVDKQNRIYQARVFAPSHLQVPPSLTVSDLPHTGSGGTVELPAQRPGSASFTLHHHALERYASPSVIVDSDMGIVHMSDNAGHFLRHVGGEPSRSLVTLVHPELAPELRTALFQALHGGADIDVPPVPWSAGTEGSCVALSVRPFRDPATDALFVLVVFDEVQTDPVSPAMIENTPDPQGDRRDALLLQLEHELKLLREKFQSTIEQSATQTEELKASNEELQAINEELRSATEELRTGKEELQSVNEELVSVNGELHAKIAETSHANDDLRNLIASTGIATVFVDRAMRLKRYTPAATGLFNLIATDIGRSLLDITHRLDYPGLADDAMQTFESLMVMEREVRAKDGRWFLVRILPYRTLTDVIDGAVLTFTDVTALRQAEEEILVGEARLRLAAQCTSDYAIIVQDPEGVVVSWNQGAEHMFGYAENEIVGQPVDLLFLPEDRSSGAPAAERQRASEGGRAEDERWHVRKDGTRLYCSGVTTPLNDGVFAGYAKIARDLTGRKSIERQPDGQTGGADGQRSPL